MAQEDIKDDKQNVVNPEEDVNAAAASENGEDSNVISEQNAEDIEPLQEDEIAIITAQRLLDAAENTPENKFLMRELEHYFDDTSDLAGLATDESNLYAFANIGKSYVDHKCEEIKNKSFSLDETTINDSIRDLLTLSMLILDPAKVERSNFDKLMKKRTQDVKPLREAFETFSIARKIFEQVAETGAAQTSHIIIEDSVQKLEELCSNGTINKEQLALGYHNIAIVFEKTIKDKNEVSSIMLQREKMYKYMKKALRLTSDIKLIKTCYECLPDNDVKKQKLVREACDRALEKGATDPSSLYTLHSLYGKSLEKSAAKRFFSVATTDERKEALHHYKQALSFANTSDRHESVLRNIAKLQKNSDKDGYFTTMMELISQHLKGKTKIKELMSLAVDTQDTGRKVFLWESAANEIADASFMPKEEQSLLMSNVISNLRGTYSPTKDKNKLEVLNKLEKKFCKKSKEKKASYIRISSKGNDYFSK